MNADGLVASLTFGGSPAQGAGFSLILTQRIGRFEPGEYVHDYGLQSPRPVTI